MTDPSAVDPLDVELFGLTIRVGASLVRESGPEIRDRTRTYVASERGTFDPTVEYPATFTGRVWRPVECIPRRGTRTRGELQRSWGRLRPPSAVRTLGTRSRSSSRVTGSSGRLRSADTGTRG